MINPTGGVVRNDIRGSGYYGSARGSRIHKGVDFICTPAQPVVAPIDGKIARVARPYADSKEYSGVVIVGRRATVKMFYLSPLPGIIGKEVVAGETIGKAQDISLRYSAEMIPHIHLQIEHCDPMIFIDVL